MIFIILDELSDTDVGVVTGVPSAVNPKVGIHYTHIMCVIVYMAFFRYIFILVIGNTSKSRGHCGEWQSVQVHYSARLWPQN